MKSKLAQAWLLMMAISTIAASQEPLKAPKKKKLNYVAIAFTNSQTALPFSKFSKLFSGNFHPGIELATGFDWQTKKKHDWIQTFNLGYSYHRWAQHSLVLYTQLGYRYKFPAGFSAETKLGAGYMRAIIATDAFSDGVEDGKPYGKITSGRSHGIASLSFSISKKIKPPADLRFFMEYQQRLQTPFIPTYVPLLPYNIMKLGMEIPIKNNHKNKQS